MQKAAHVALAGVVASAAMLADLRRAEACGCLSPPAVTEGDYAVNQRAEQIIFEVEPNNWITAHVLIKYAGAPEQFAWIIPVPEAPELGLTPVSAFGLIDRATVPNVIVSRQDMCPISDWQCRYYDQPYCGDRGDDNAPDGVGGGALDAGGSGSGSGEPPPVTIIDQKVVGDYQTITFRADQATAATQWLRDNGFIVNPTTSIYMEPYIQQNFVFVAAKLVAGAGVDGIKPLRLHYRAPYPMVPLILTAVAAEPNLTVTSFIYANKAFTPLGHPEVSIDPARISQDRAGRTNYPMVLARTVDDAGGDAFVREYVGSSFIPTPGLGGCCQNGGDFCGLGNNGTCECPTAAFDQADCAAQGDLTEGIDFVDHLSTKYQYLTRLTTRVSAEEMTFDPQFQPDPDSFIREGRITLEGTQLSLARCEDAILDKTLYEEIDADQDCASLYCGQGGRCVTTTEGAACACGAGYVAQRYLDLDNAASVTCVPATPPVDLRAGGDVLPDACAGVSCGTGDCIDRNGVPVCECDAGTAAIASAAGLPKCLAVARGGNTPGAQDYSKPLRDIDVCAPPPPTCGEGGWLERGFSSRPGIACPGVALDPPQALTVPPGDKPTCDSTYFGCGGCQSSGGDPLAALGSAWLVGALIFRRRRRSIRA